jgi:hypothetical protein
MAETGFYHRSSGVGVALGSDPYVVTFNGRYGVVVPVAGDYTASYITNVPAGTIAATNVQAALAELDADIVALDAATDADVTALEAADVVLQDNIDTEEAARIAADGVLTTAISDEETARIAADLVLQGNIDTEEAARIAADGVLTTAISDEETARIAADALKADKATTITAGSGLTGGGDLSANRTLTVGAGTGIAVNADDVALAAIADDTLLANVSGGALAPSATTLTQLLDATAGATRATVLRRGASAWEALVPSVSGHVLKFDGTDTVFDAAAGGGDMLAANNLSDVADVTDARNNISAALYGHIYGLTTANDTITDGNSIISVAVGEAASDDATDPVLMRLTAARYKSIASGWAVGGTGGSAAGGLDTGSETTNTWYYIYLIMRSDTGVVDVLLSASATAPTMPANYDHKRRIAAVFNDGSSNIIQYNQAGDEFLMETPVSVLSTTGLGTSRSTFGTYCPPITGAKAKLRGAASNASNPVIVLITATDENDTDPSSPTGNGTFYTHTAGGAMFFQVDIRSVAGLVGARSSSASTNLDVVSFGWIDQRNKEGLG